MEEHIYFVSYGHSVGQGMIRISLKKPIETYDDVLAIKEFIDKDLSDNTVIINWIPLKN
ncbi:MAG: hypothetical protein IJ880_04630 [Bacilli bacterium]|nr:hypothetical protein [Bacilli bacterium]MBR3119709.1 hypothetical protein [Oceanobacillus sp.]